MRIEQSALVDLVADPANARKHSPKNLEAIKGSLARFGQQKPIVVTADGVVLAGNGTLEAARALGWETIAVQRTDLEGADATAYAIADNRSGELAEWDAGALSETLKSLQELDFDLGSIGFDEADLANLIATPEPAEGLTDPDELPENVEPRTKPGDLWVLGEHRLLCGDSTNVQHVERLMAGEKAALCFTSPPYADQREYNGGKELSTEHLATFIRAAHGAVDLFAVNLGLSRKDGAVNPYWDDYIREAKDCGLKLLSWNVWHKGVQGSIGQLSAMFPIAHEWVFVFGARTVALNKTVPNRTFHERKNDATADRQADGSVRYKEDVEHRAFRALSTVFESPPEMSRKDGVEHPAKFPVVFPQAYIEACTDRGAPVYEPFTGSGSTLIACEKTDRRCFGMEIDPRYCDVIVARWENFTGKKAQLQSQDEAHGSGTSATLEEGPIGKSKRNAANSQSPSRHRIANGA